MIKVGCKGCTKEDYWLSVENQARTKMDEIMKSSNGFTTLVLEELNCIED